MIKRFYMLLQRHSQINYIKNQNHLNVVFKISALSPEVSIYHETS